jgi:hypothetical protein
VTAAQRDGGMLQRLQYTVPGSRRGGGLFQCVEIPALLPLTQISIFRFLQPWPWSLDRLRPAG